MHKQDGVSTIALVCVAVADISKINQVILDTEERLKIETSHWSHSKWGIRKEFTESISKRKILSKDCFYKNPFHESTSYEYTLRNLIIERNISALIIEGKKSRFYKRRIKKILRDKGISIKNLRTANNMLYPVLRIADLIAGIARNKHYNPDEKKIDELYRLISSRISTIYQ